jgi:hypothetical protein
VRPYRTVFRHPDQWCPSWEWAKNESSPSAAGVSVVVDFDSARIEPKCCGHRHFTLLEYKGITAQPGDGTCEMNIVIGD